MTLKRLLNTSRLWFNNGLPSYVIFLITAQCNAKCKFCFYWENIEGFAQNKDKELSLAEIQAITKHLGKVQHLTLGGGEPFLRKDITDICRAFHDNANVQSITIPTNAFLTPRIVSEVQRMLDYCPETFFRISLSLDDIKERHDAVRGVPGNFERLIETYRKLIKLREQNDRLSMDVSSVFSSFNQDRIHELFQYVYEHLDVDNHNLLFVRGNPLESIAKDVDVDKYDQLREYITQLARRRENRPFSPILRAMYDTAMDNISKTARQNKAQLLCRTAARHLISINEQGDVFPCELLPDRKLGNLRDYGYDLRKLLQNHTTGATRKWIIKSKCFCTWECAMNSNLLYDPKTYPKLALHAVKNVFSPVLSKSKE